MRKIEIDDRVWKELQKMAVPFEETPNDVLKRVFNIGPDTTRPSPPSAIQIKKLPKPPSPSSQMSAKARGNLNRQRYFEVLKAQGIPMQRERGVVYRADLGAVAAIPSATERSPGHWFLGLAAGLFNDFSQLNLVLLCQRGEELLDFVIPWAELKNLLSDLSRDANNQLKFNVSAASPGRYTLSIPAKGPFDLTAFLERREILKNRPASGPASNPSIKTALLLEKRESIMRPNTTCTAFFYKTNPDWINFLKHSGKEDGINFWRSPTRDCHLAPGSYFYFIEKGTDQVVGRGFYKEIVRMNPVEAWDRFGTSNGAPTRERFFALIGGVLGRSNSLRNKVSCIILDQVEWLPKPVPFGRDLGRWTVKSFDEDEIEDILEAFD